MGDPGVSYCAREREEGSALPSTTRFYSSHVDGALCCDSTQLLRTRKVQPSTPTLRDIGGTTSTLEGSRTDSPLRTRAPSCNA